MNILHDSLRPRKRDLFLTGIISDNVVTDLEKGILEVNRHDVEIANALEGSGLNYSPPPINIFIDSPGGAVVTGLGLISIMEASKTPIHTICTGQAASFGAIVLMSGHKRSCFKRSTIMLHQLSGGAVGSFQDMVERMEYLTRLQESLDALVAEKTKITKAKLREIKERKMDFYLTAEDAVRYKVVDSIIESL